MLTTSFIHFINLQKNQLISVDRQNSIFQHFMDWASLTSMCLCADLDTASSGSALLLGCG